MKNQIRKDAEKIYNAALAAVKVAETGTDIEAYNKADAKLTEARIALIAAETAYPTKDETRRSNELYRLRNRGLDV